MDKIAGMLTHPLTFENTQTLANGVMYHFAKTNQNVGCHPLYRLDRNTSGLVVFAKMPQLIYQNKALQGLKAVKNKRIYPVPLYAIYSPGIRAYDGIRIMAQGLYPELYKEK